MRTVAIESLRRHLGGVLRSEEPVLVTRYGKLAGVFYPTPDPKLLKPTPAPAPKRKRQKPERQLPLLRGD